MFSRLIAAAALAVCASANAAAQDPENTLVLELKNGNVVIELLPDLAPNHVERIKTLARQGFYDNVPFHRVIPGFMAQTGDPTGTGAGGSELPDLKQEFNPTPHTRGIVSMARTPDPDSANSQFFIMFDTVPSLDGQYTVFGRVLDGMEHVDAIKAGTSRNNGAVQDPDVIVKARIAADGS
ncbi:MAG: peptidylprolyl isomerase [Pseudomonadota bacterium]